MFLFSHLLSPRQNCVRVTNKRHSYAISKLIQVLAIRSLAALVPSSSVTINTMTPGACKSDFHRENSGVSKLVHSVMEKAIARTAEVGSRTLVLALEAGEESHGTYMADGTVHE